MHLHADKRSSEGVIFSPSIIYYYSLLEFKVVSFTLFTSTYCKGGS